MKILKALKFACEALTHIPGDAWRYATNQATEERLLIERLARRYDPSIAMSESFERAREKIIAGTLQQVPPRPSGDPFIDQHYESLRANPRELTDTQKAALEVQRRTLTRNLKS